MSEQYQHMTLRDKLTEIDRLSRELNEHIEHGFIPKTRELSRIARKGRNGEEETGITDRTIRDCASQVIASERFTEDIYNSLSRLLVSVDEELTRMING